MTLTDPLADMLTRIRNGGNAHHKTVSCVYSSMKENILSVLKSEGYIQDFSISADEKGFKTLVVTLRYYDEKSAIKVVKRVSKPGCRVYQKSSEIKPFYNGLGVQVVSTSQGVMSDNEARRLNLGGEIICQLF
jgi:small subunit ribosomal protein S8